MLEAISCFLSKYAVTVCYIILMSIIAVIATAHDKIRAIKGGRRVRERTLLLISALGGSVMMLVMMHLIRHKTKHKKFMIGIPLIIILQAVILYYFGKWDILI